MNPFLMAFANSYNNGEKIRPDLATSYQATTPQPDYGFSFGGQSSGQTASQAPAPTPYTQAQANAYIAANPPAPAPTFTIGGGNVAAPTPAPAPAPAPAPVATQLPAQPSVNLGMSNQTYTPNPYLDKQAEAIRSQVTQNLQRNIMPQISGNAMMVGGYGGSRQGVVEANALNDANQGLSNSLANLYGTDYTNAMNRNLQQQGLDNSYNLGLGNLGLGFQNSNQNFYTAQRGQDLEQMAVGSRLATTANQGYIDQGTGIYDTGTQYQQAPWNRMGNFNNAVTPYTGYGATATGTTSQSTNPWAQALGGAVAGAQFGKFF